MGLNPPSQKHRFARGGHIGSHWVESTAAPSPASHTIGSLTPQALFHRGGTIGRWWNKSRSQAISSIKEAQSNI